MILNGYVFLFIFLFFISIDAELQHDSLCDPEGSLREFTIFEKLARGVAHEKCLCHFGYYGRYCEKIHRCVSGRPFSINCTEPPKAFESVTNNRCSIKKEREIDVCICFTGYKGNRCEHVDVSDHPKVEYLRLSNENPETVNDNERLGIVKQNPTSQDEAMVMMEKRFWYLAFCIAIAAILSILLIGLYFVVMQTIYKTGLKHITYRELQSRLRSTDGKNMDDDPPPYENNDYVYPVSIINENPTDRLYENMESPTEEVPTQYRPLYVHV